MKYPHDIPFISSLFYHSLPITTLIVVGVPLYPHEIPINYWVNHHPPVIKHGLPTMVDYTGYQLILGYISYITLYTSFYPMISPVDIPIEMPNC